MQKVEWNFTMSESEKKERDALCQSLVTHPLITKWMHDYEVDASFICRHAYKFKDYVDCKSQCGGCNGLAFCMQKKKGYILIPNYDHGALSLELVGCEYRRNQVLKTAHRKQFLYCDMSEEQLLYSFDHIALEKETPSYVALVMEMIKHIQNGESKGYYLCGEPGTGKTYLSCCFINEMAKQGKRCAFVNVSAYLSALKSKLQDKDAYTKQLNALRNAPYAVLDDIGGESTSNWSRDEILLPILNERMEKGLVTWFTSNYDMANLERYYSLNSKIVNDKVGAKRLLERMKALSFEKELNGKNRR